MIKQTTTAMRNKYSLLAALLLLIAAPAFSQTPAKYSAAAGTIAINGTSTLHNWEMTAQKPTCEALFIQNGTGAITDLSALSFTLPAESLKSGKGPMDKNAY